MGWRLKTFKVFLTNGKTTVEKTVESLDVDVAISLALQSQPESDSEYWVETIEEMENASNQA